MPIAMADMRLDGASEAAPEPFPVRSKQVVGTLNGSRIEVTCMPFADKILITIAHDGRLAHWVHVPLESTDPNTSHLRVARPDDSQLLPMPHLTASSILGGGNSERETLGQLFATQIASAILLRNPEETRLLVVGMGFKNSELERSAFLKVLDLVLSCI